MKAPPPPATVYLVDDDPSVLRAVARVVRAAGLLVAAFSSPQEFLARLDPDAPGCLVLDVTMPGLNGLELQQALARVGHRMPIIFLTGNGDIPMSVRAMKAGAVDFLSKPCHNDELLAAIQQALAQDRQNRMEQQCERAFVKLLATLTPREHEVMLGVVAGKLNKQIAADLGTAEKTVKTHRGHMMAKLQVQSVADLVRQCAAAGIRPSAR
jgi:FixJ family two-component response regulator